MEITDYNKLTPEQKQEQAEYIAKRVMEGTFDPNAKENKMLFKFVCERSTASLVFLRCLNRHRAELISVSEQTFMGISTVMQGIIMFIQGSWMMHKPLYNALKAKIDNKTSLSSKEREQWTCLEGKNKQFIEIMELILILSQTFSTNENSKKKLIYEMTLDNRLFADAVLWKRVMKRFISETLARQIELLKKQKIKISKELQATKLLSIAQTTIITYQFNMSTFNVPKDVQDESINYILEEFKLNRESLGI